MNGTKNLAITLELSIQRNAKYEKLTKFQCCSSLLVCVWAYVRLCVFIRLYGIFSGDRVRGIFRKIFRTCQWNVSDNVFAICIGVYFIILSVKCAGLLASGPVPVQQFDEEKIRKFVWISHLKHWFESSLWKMDRDIWIWSCTIHRFDWKWKTPANWCLSECFNLGIAETFPEHLFTRTRTFHAYASVCIQILFMTLLKRLLLSSCRFIYHKINDNPFVSDQK